MSSAILLVAIVAIWACALVPRWVRRSHEAASQPEVPVADEASLGQEDGDADEEYGYGELDEDDAIAIGQVDDAYDAEDVTQTGNDDLAIDPPGLVPHAHVSPGQHAGPGLLVGHLPAGDVGHGHYAGPEDNVAGPADTPRAEDLDEPGAHRVADRPAQRYQEPPAPPPLPRAADRGRVLRARRRTLTLLTLLCVAAFGGAALRISAWWLVIPPAVMLAFYVMLLRAAVYADTENASRRAAAQARAAAAARQARAAAARERERERERERAAAAARTPQPDAEVIDIGERAAQASAQDEPYDQYADGTARAIGD
jgi:hypothetical protein